MFVYCLLIFIIDIIEKGKEKDKNIEKETWSIDYLLPSLTGDQAHKLLVPGSRLNSWATLTGLGTGILNRQCSQLEVSEGFWGSRTQKDIKQEKSPKVDRFTWLHKGTRGCKFCFKVVLNLKKLGFYALHLLAIGQRLCKCAEYVSSSQNPL